MLWLIGSTGMLGTELENLLKGLQIPFISTDLEIDIGNPGQLNEFTSTLPLSWIVNCAAYTAVDQAEEEPEQAFRTNAEGPLNIARIANEKGAKLIHVSTDYVFDGKKQEAYLETDMPNPLSAYGQSKYKGEQNIAGILNQFFIVRTAWLYGVHGKNFVLTMLRLLQGKKEIRVVNDQFGSPTYTRDLAEAILRIIQNDGDQYGIYHFTNLGQTSWYKFACLIADIAEARGMIGKNCLIHQIPSVQYPTRAQRPTNSTLSNEKIKISFQINIRSWEAALEAFLAEIDTRQNGKQPKDRITAQ